MKRSLGGARGAFAARIKEAFAARTKGAFAALTGDSPPNMREVYRILKM